MSETTLIPHYCTGANAELENAVPICLGQSDRSVHVACPFFASERCLVRVSRKDELGEVKREVQDHRNGPTANSYPECLYSSQSGIRLV